MMDTENTARLIYLALLLAALAGWVMVEYRNRMGQALRTGLAWAMIFIGLMAGYVLIPAAEPDGDGPRPDPDQPTGVGRGEP